MAQNPNFKGPDTSGWPLQEQGVAKFSRTQRRILETGYMLWRIRGAVGLTNLFRRVLLMTARSWYLSWECMWLSGVRYLQCSFRWYRLLAILSNLPRNSCQYNVMVANLPQNHREIAAKQNTDQILRNDFRPCLDDSSSGLYTVKVQAHKAITDITVLFMKWSQVASLTRVRSIKSQCAPNSIMPNLYILSRSRPDCSTLIQTTRVSSIK
jgi:hypothetical protein